MGSSRTVVLQRSALVLLRAVGVVGLVFGLYLIKHKLTFSLTNFTFFLLLPIGPLLVGAALMLLLVPPPDREPLGESWLVLFVAVGLSVFFVDQYFAYLHDGDGQGFYGWYRYLVEHRSWAVSVRGHNPQGVDGVGAFGYLLETIKLCGILYLGVSVYRDDRKAARASGGL